MKQKYILCPRCELNYIPADDPTRKYCDICLAELNLIDSANLIPDEDAEQILCPKCGVNYIDAGEEMCEACMEKERKVKQEGTDEWNDDEADDDMLVDDEEPVPISFDELAEEEEEAERDESAVYDEEDTFETVDIDDADYDDDDDDDDESDLEGPDF